MRWEEGSGKIAADRGSQLGDCRIQDAIIIYSIRICYKPRDSLLPIEGCSFWKLISSCIRKKSHTANMILSPITFAKSFGDISEHFETYWIIFYGIWAIKYRIKFVNFDLTTIPYFRVVSNLYLVTALILLFRYIIN